MFSNVSYGLREILGSNPAPSKLFSREPAVLKFVECRSIQTFNGKEKFIMNLAMLLSLVE